MTLAPASRLGRLARGVGSLSEQVLMSAANLATTLIAARALSENAFAAAGVGITLLLVVGGLHRNAIIIPFVIMIGGQEGPARRSAAWVWASLALATCIAAFCIVFGLAGWFFDIGPGWMQIGFLCGGVLILPMLVYDYLRRWMIGAQKLVALLVATGTLFVVQVATLCLLLFVFEWRSAFAAAIAIAVGALCGILVGSVVMSRAVTMPDAEPWPRLLRRLVISMRLNMLGHLALMSYTHATVIILGGLLPAAAIALFLASRTLINPVATIFTAVDNSFAFRLARALKQGGVRAVVGQALRQIGVQFALAAPFVFLLLMFATPLCKALLGPAYAADAPALLWWWTFPYIAMLISLPLESALQTLGMSRELLASRLTMAVVGTCATVGLALLYGLEGAIMAMGLSLVLGIAIVGTVMWNSYRLAPP